MKRHTSLALFIAGLAGAAIWALSPYATGHREPWDADGFYYIISLVASGVASGILAPRPLWAQYLGAVLGQMMYALLFLELGPLLVIGLGFLLVYSLLFVAGGFVGSRIRIRLSRTASTV